MDHNDKVKKGSGAKNFVNNITRYRTYQKDTTNESDREKAKGVTKVGFEELMESERKRKKQKASEGYNNDTKKVIPRFEIGQRVYYFIEEKGNEKWHAARVMGISYPDEDSQTADSHQITYKIQPDREEGQTYQQTTRLENELRDWTCNKSCLVGTFKTKKEPLLPLDRVGIDTCSALSVSSKRDDFIWLD